ncbi:ABC transporter ATP-binding protein [Caloramator australicus]|uniref:Maltose/maltodextrin transport ATP-binding protein MalK n=1 Tax=Caloramator australicus RC3 TaxID=857293 RepID=I7LGD2_9CLOT|nr:ABC transporter ATP-binding protein [Caloramator australicus]CCJ33205.1 Maltose/maltodextrin transport ATP-binding protein MalK [Caloramator australicus RC3]
MAELKLMNINKRYPNGFHAVKDLNIYVSDGEFLSLVGPSGCGKSTTLRMIAGLEDISEGELYIGNRLSNDIPAKDRGIAMVFQSYALFPHMTVEANITFGLKIKKVPEKIRKEKLNWVLELLDLKGLENRKPAELSGGQRQRVALGRALVLDPDVLLLDEPLSNLDAKLRVKMRTELKRIHKKLKSTIIYVTHDQAEAMTLSDRIAVMKDGKLMQIGTPSEIYNNPANKFVAGFVGSPAMNFISGELKLIDNKNYFVFEMGKIELPELLKEKIKESIKGKDVVLGIRPEDIEISFEKDNNSLTGVTSIRETLGSDDYVTVEMGNILLTVRVEPEKFIPMDEKCYLKLKGNKMHLFNKDED